MIARIAHTRLFRNAARYAAAAGIAVGVVSCKDTTGPVTPETPTGVTVVLLSPTSAKVTWNPASDPSSIRSYNVFRNGAKVGEVSGPPFVDTGLSELATYRYGVSANGVNGLLSATSDDTPANVVTPPDATPPSVTLTTPANAATGVDRSTKIAATFSEALDAATAIAANFTVTVAGAAIPGSIAYSSATKTIEFTPASALPSSAVVSVSISTGIKDGAGNAMTSPVTFSFTTRDDIPPSVLSTTIPASGDVSTSQVISVTMSEPIDASSLSSATVRLTAGSAVAGTISYDSPSRTITFTPTGGLTGSTDYVFIVGPGIKDVAGNVSTVAFSKSFRTVDATPPTVLSVTPADQATSVAAGTPVNVVFSKDMDASTITTSSMTLRLSSSGAFVGGTVVYTSATRTASYSPSSALSASTGYTIAVSNTVRAANGIPLAQNFLSTFTTAAPAPPQDTTPPTILSSVPAPGSVDVSITTPISITFSEAMSVGSVNGSTVFVSAPGGGTVAGTVSYDNQTNKAIITPAAPLQAGTTYTLVATTGLKDLAGNSLASAYSASFATVVTVPPPDTTPPTVVSTVPANGSMEVLVTSPIRVTFSEAMTATTINTGTIGLSVVGIPVGGTVSYDPSTRSAAFVESAGILAEGKVYTITVTTGVRDASGNPMASSFSASFQTQDLTPPTIVSRSPSPGSTNVGIGSTIRVGFSEAMTPSTINTSTLSVSAGGSPVAGSVSYDANTNVATFAPSSPLANNQAYSVLVTTGARDLAGNALGSNDSFSFTTAPAAPAFDISGVTGALGWWQTTTAGSVGIHFHIVFDQNGSSLTRSSSTCSSGGQDSCITLAQNQAGQGAIGPASPGFVWVLITNATGTLSGNQISFTLTNANGKTFTFTGTVTSPYHMTGTISGPTLPAEAVSFDRPAP